MTETIVFENDYGIVRYNDTDQYVYHTWKQPISGAALRDVLNAGLNALSEHQAVKWLSDDRKNAEVSDEDIQFSVGDWGPRAAQAGWKYWALVVPEDIAGRDSMRGVIEAFWNLGVRVRIFTDLDNATDWIRKPE